ncbi:restriction endonuclease subunit S [Nannocystis sp. RBIL2]|uniref:restriction endonuclease subunit S n=1 Tax=Nannocystis sp. RBIL2 TaxID=2996788 RepID=UPI00227003FD|nr:restriction endonuclease subunit S [Nannocystis sp. RBIL2]MCY1065609.1 restriction endonuclease subunit S [Nannocystis sp. RBIL2]
MVADWKTTTIGNLIDSAGGELQTGPFGSQLHAYDYTEDGAVRVVPTSAIGRRRIDGNGVPRISSAKAAELERHRLKTGDILFARRGVQAAGLSALVTPEQEGWLCGTGAIRLRIPGGVVDHSFLSFALSTETAYEWIQQHAIGATMPNLNESVVRWIPIRLPPLNEQRRIAAVLGSVDDRIELNRQKIRTLEEMAQVLFKSWFVNFDDLVEIDDTPIGAIPVGWRVAGIGHVAEIVRDIVDPAGLAPDTPYIGLEHMPRRSAALETWGRASEAGSAKSKFRRGDILFGKLRPYFHKVAPAFMDGVSSTDILVIRPHHPDWRWFAFGHLFSDAMVAHASAAADGTKMPRANWKDLCHHLVAIPPRSRAAEYNAIVEPIYDKIALNVQQSRALTALRDLLLPKLISGQLRVPESLDQALEALSAEVTP